jgi:hypothetical protein
MMKEKSKSLSSLSSLANIITNMMILNKVQTGFDDIRKREKSYINKTTHR